LIKSAFKQKQFIRLLKNRREVSYTLLAGAVRGDNDRQVTGKYRPMISRPIPVIGKTVLSGCALGARSTSTEAERNREAAFFAAVFLAAYKNVLP